MGFKYLNNYYEINYCWGLFATSHEALGGSFQYHHEFNFKEILSLSPGAFIGFWGSSGESDYENSDFYYYGHEYLEFFFGGLMTKGKIGYKNIYATITYSMFLGTDIRYGLQYGIQIIF